LPASSKPTPSGVAISALGVGMKAVTFAVLGAADADAGLEARVIVLVES
jgi:hypothetical protein